MADPCPAMMITTTLPRFDAPTLGARIDELMSDELDALDFGVIGFDAATLVKAYNAFESKAAGLRADSVIDRPLFKVVAPCMLNFMVSERFDEASASRTALDAVIPYVLTLRMRPTRVLLRLVADPAAPLRYVLVQRRV